MRFLSSRARQSRRLASGLRWREPDLTAGITLAAYAIPVSLAYAGLAGLPPQVGLYGYLLGGLGYALFGSSRQLAVGPTSAISLMVGGTVAQMAGGDAVRYAQIATLAGFVVALMSVLAWLLRCKASRCAWSKRLQRHAICSEPRAWQPKSATSTALRRWPT
jgi:MFS superfamily sulfate permease-like transporter